MRSSGSPPSDLPSVNASVTVVDSVHALVGDVTATRPAGSPGSASVGGAAASGTSIATVATGAGECALSCGPPHAESDPSNRTMTEDRERMLER